MITVKKGDGSSSTIPTPCSDCSMFYYGGSNLAPVATPTDVIRVGPSASKTVYVRAVRIRGAATAAGSMIVVINKRSTAGTTTSATLNAVTPVPAVTGQTATGSVNYVSSANVDAQGTLVSLCGAGRVQMVAIGSAATSGAGAPYEFVPPMPIALAKGSTEYLTIEGGGSAIPSGGKWDWEVVTEEV